MLAGTRSGYRLPQEPLWSGRVPVSTRMSSALMEYTSAALV